MNRTRHFMRVVAGGLICAGLAAFAAAQDAPRADDKQISGLVGKLADKDFRARDQAQRDLIAIGAPARTAVEAALASTDLETVQRAKMILAGIARGAFEAASKKAQDSILWSFEMKSGMVGSPCIKDGVAYAADGDRTVHAVDLKTGKEKWSQAKLPGDETTAISQIELSDAVLVVARADGTLAGLDFASGKVNWKYEPGANANANGANANGNFVINGRGGMAGMAVMRAGIGGGRANSLPVSMAAGGSVVCLAEGTGITALDAKSGQKKSAIELNNASVPMSRLCLEGGRLIFTAFDQRCHCYSLPDLKEIWPGGISAGQLGGNMISSGDKTYFVFPANATAVDSATGKELWTCQTEDNNRPAYYAGPYVRGADSLKIADGLLYAFDGTRLAVVDLKETRFKWNRTIEYWHDAHEDESPNAQGMARMGGFVVNGARQAAWVNINGRMVGVGQNAGMISAAIEGMTAYVGASSQMGVPYGLYAVGLADGVPLWRLKGVSLSGAPVAADGVLYFGTGDESAAVAAAGFGPVGVPVGVPVGIAAGAAPAAQPASAPADDGKAKLPPGLHAMKIK
jgi:outer membrane protein assembly factor BamB